MSDAKRTPYRQASAPSAGRKARGTLVSRAGEPESDDARPIAKRPDPVDPDAGIFSGLVAPHPASTPNEWGTQALLTLVALPLLVTTFVFVGWLDTRRAYEVVKNGREAPRPFGIAHPVAWVLGALPLALLCFAREWPWPVAAIGIGVPFVALFARRVLRQRILDREAVIEQMRSRKR